jgi:RNA polymerase sigma factor (sigma-70 family)
MQHPARRYRQSQTPRLVTHGRRDIVRAVDEDLVLLQRWRDGEPRAGEALCGRYFDEIYRFFQYKLAGEADDLTQQTFLACVRARDQFRAQSSFRTYLFSIARNELYMRLRKRPKGEHVDLEVSSLNELVSSPSQRVGKEQELEQVRAALRQLPVEQQVLLEFHYWHDLDAAALAELFGTSAGTIRVRLLRARKALRGQLAGEAEQLADDRLSRSLCEPAGEDEGPA